MATQLFLVGDPAGTPQADTHLGTNNAKRDGTASGWKTMGMATARGAGVAAGLSTGTAAGPTNGIEPNAIAGPFPGEWISPPVAADVTISGTITANIWASESNMSANVAINVIIEIIRAATLTTANSNTLVTIVQSTNVVEAAVTTRAASNFTSGMTSGGYTGQTLNRGDRLRIRVVGDDAGTMASGYAFSISWNGTSAAADGDSYVTFTENITFESAPGGSVVYLTDTASAVSTASDDREAWTTAGMSSTSFVGRIAAAGWTVPLQMQRTSVAVDWFTRPLTAFTLEGKAVAKIWTQTNNAAVAATVRCEIARVEGDGTSPTVWASWCLAPAGTDNGRVAQANAERTINVSGDALSISDGQRLRIRFYADDPSNIPMAGGANEISFAYNYSAVPGSFGDSYITFPQTLTEYGGGGPATIERSASLSGG